MELIPYLPPVPYKQFSTVSAVGNGRKEEIESVQFHRQRMAGGKSRAIFVLAQAEPNRAFGAVKYPATPAYRLTVYEPVTGTWGKLQPVPGFSDGLPVFCRFDGVCRKLVVVGGWNPATSGVSKAVFVYDFVAAAWRRGADMPGAPRSLFACASDSNRTVFVAGGHDEEKNALRSAMAYDVVKDEWVPLPEMATPRDECKGIFHGGKFHVIGGYRTDMQGRFGRSAEAFDVAAWQWDRVQENMLETGTCPRTCVAGAGGMFYWCRAGHVAVLQGATWLEVAKLPMDVHVDPYMATWQEKLVVLGSARYGGPYMAYLLDLQHYTWTKVEAPVEYSGHIQAGCCLEI